MDVECHYWHEDAWVKRDQGLKRSKVTDAVRKEVVSIEEKWDEGMIYDETTRVNIKRNLDEFTRILDRVNADFEESLGFYGGGDEGGDIKSLANIIDDEGLEFCKCILTHSWATGKSANPLSSGGTEIEMSLRTTSGNKHGSSGESDLELTSKYAKPDDVKLTIAKDPPPEEGDSDDSFDDNDDGDDKKLPSVPPADQLKPSWTEHIEPATNYWTNEEVILPPPAPPPPPPPRVPEPWTAV